MDNSKKSQREKTRTSGKSEKLKIQHQSNTKKRDVRGHDKNARCSDSPPVRRRNIGSDEFHSSGRKNPTKCEENQTTRSSRDCDSDIENGNHSKHRQHHHHKKRQHKDEEESFEELSRRKKMIESELNALDEAEAAAVEESPPQRRRRQRSGARSHSDRHSYRQLQVEQLVRIKQEPNDDENDRHKRQKRVSRIRRHSNAGSGSEHHEWGRPEEKTSKPSKSEKEKAKPNFETSGKLAEDTNTYNGVVIKYNEPAEARKPRRKWRLYPFKGSTSLPFIPVHRQSAYLLGRSRLIADIPIDHPSCSKQHAVLQFRFLPYERADGTTGKSVRPYVIDLDSSNGTYVNNNRVDPRRYVELFEKDVLKFGFSTRVYVLLHEDSKHEVDDAGS